MRLIPAILIFCCALPATAQPTEWRIARDREILLRAHDYEPRPIRLEAGIPVRLHLVNPGRKSLSFSAPDFFRAARVHASHRAEVADGHVRLAPGERRVISLVPREGRYRARSRNLLHRLVGMSARIIVEPAS